MINYFLIINDILSRNLEPVEKCNYLDDEKTAIVIFLNKEAISSKWVSDYDDEAFKKGLIFERSVSSDYNAIEKILKRYFKK